jgi:hypothetical protein
MMQEDASRKGFGGYANVTLWTGRCKRDAVDSVPYDENTK